MFAQGLVASIRWLCTGDEGNRVIVGASSSSNAVGRFIQLDVHHAGRLTERLNVAVLRHLDGPFHEFGPNGGGGGGAAQAQVAVIVEADPDNAQQVAGVAGEPAVMRGAGLARGGGGEAHAAHSGGSAVV